MTAWMDGRGYDALVWLCTAYMLSLHALVYVAGIAAAVWAVGRAGPSARAGVWAAGAVGLLVMLGLGHDPEGWWSAEVVPGAAAEVMLRFTSLEMRAEALGTAALRWVVALQLVWMAGVAAVVARMARDWGWAVVLTRRAEDPSDPRWRRLLGEARRELSVWRTVRLRVSGEVATPLTWGWLRPVILLPREAEAWTDGEARAVLLHETAHIRRLDTPLFGLALLGAAWFWFHPAVWWALSRWRVAREEACDRAVLHAGVRASGYANLLMRLAEPGRADAGARTLAVSAGIVRGSRLYLRIDAVLRAAGRPAERHSALVRGAMAAVLLAWMVGLGTLRAWPTPAALDAAARAGGWRTEVVARVRRTNDLLSRARPVPSGERPVAVR